jgi:hypothetical protein
MSPNDIREYFEELAPKWEYWIRKNAYYHNRIWEMIGGAVPSGKNVLVYGTGTGDLLHYLQPARGVGTNVAEGLTERAREKYPQYEFVTSDVDTVTVPDDFRPDYIVIHNMLDMVHDIWKLMAALNKIVHEHTVLIITTSNPMWSPILKLASALGRRIPSSPRNYVTNKDIESVMRLQGFDVVEEGMMLPVPKRIPLLGALLNRTMPDIPVLRYFGSAQYLIARPRRQRHPLKVSVVIPCHNEEGNVENAVARTPDMSGGTEIVLVNDGSKDSTKQVAQEVMRTDTRVRLVSTDMNQGKANAVKAGMDAASGDVLIILDADMTVRPEDLPMFIQPMEEGMADFVNGTRLVYPMQDGAMPFTNFLGNKVFCFLASFVLRQRVSDTLCGTKAFFKSDYLNMPLQSKERWGDFDFLYSGSRLKLRFLEVPVHYQERVAGESKMNVLKDGMLFLRASIQGWGLTRFPGKYPLPARREPIAGWEEILVDGE